MNNTNEQIFSNKIKEAFDEKYDGIPFSDEIDFEEKSVFIPHHLQTTKAKMTSRRRRTYIATAASLILVCSSVFGVLISNGSVDAVRTGILDFINSTTGKEHKVSTKATIVQIDTLNDEENLKKAKDIIPNLIYFERITNKYIFDYMVVDKQNKNSIISITNYHDKNQNTLVLQQDIVSEEDSLITIENAEKSEKYLGGTLIYDTNVEGETGLNSIGYLKGSTFIALFGHEDMESITNFMQDSIIPKI